MSAFARGLSGALALVAAVLLALHAGLTQAQAVSVVGCDPRSLPFAGVNVPLPWATGSDPLEAETDAAVGLFVWCPQPVPAGSWNLSAWAYRLKSVPAPKVDLWEIRGRVLASAEPASAVRAEFARYAVPFEGEQQFYEFRRLRHAACVKATTFPLPVNLPPPSPPWVQGFNFPARPDGTPFCGLPPVPPVVAEVWKAVGGSIFRQSGGRLASLTVRKAPVDAACDPALAPRISVGTKTFMPLSGGPAGEATECTKR